MSKIPQYLHNTISTAVLNTKIAYLLFMNMLKYVAVKTKKKVNVTRDLLNNTIYAFRYRDLSKEAIMALAESLLY